MSTAEITAEHVILRPAQITERQLIYEWLVVADSARSILGPPIFPECPSPTWEEFEADYAPHYFDDSAPGLGRCFIILAGNKLAGQVTYNDIWERDGQKRTELDIWMRSEEFCGRGFGTDALIALCRMLSHRFGVLEFLVQPSARNPRAIRAYEKAGFRKVNLSAAAAREEWGPSDYWDSVYMVKRRSQI